MVNASKFISRSKFQKRSSFNWFNWYIELDWVQRTIYNYYLWFTFQISNYFIHYYALISILNMVDNLYSCIIRYSNLCMNWNNSLIFFIYGSFNFFDEVDDSIIANFNMVKSVLSKFIHLARCFGHIWLSNSINYIWASPSTRFDLQLIVPHDNFEQHRKFYVWNYVQISVGQLTNAL